jgi:hypothetical protein
MGIEIFLVIVHFVLLPAIVFTVLLIRFLFFHIFIIRYCNRHDLVYYGVDIPGSWDMIKGSALERKANNEVKWGIGRRSSGTDLITFQYRYWYKRPVGEYSFPFKMALIPGGFGEKGSIHLRRKKQKAGLFARLFSADDQERMNRDFWSLYSVRSYPPHMAKRFFSADMMDVFMKNPKLGLIAKRGTLLIYEPGDLGGIFPTFRVIFGLNPFKAWMDESNNIMESIRDISKRNERQ